MTFIDTMVAITGFIPFALLMFALFITQHDKIERWIDTFPHKKAVVQAYEPEPILPMYEDQLESKVQAILDSRVRNPRLARDYGQRRLWQLRFDLGSSREDSVFMDNEDEETIRSWDGKIIRHSKGESHKSSESCYYCGQEGRNG